jgi:Methylamine utilization protein MauJ/SEC-C motif
MTRGRHRLRTRRSPKKTGRNEPCPCGSGKKFKHCHGSTMREGDAKPMPRQSRAQSVPGPAIKMDLPQLGLPGNTVHLITVNRFRDPNDPRNAARPAGAAGEYRVTFVLSRPGFSLQPEYQYSFAELVRGDSHLAIAKPAYTHPQGDFDQVLIDGVSPDGRFRFTALPNERGFLGKVESDPFLADGFNDAEQKAYRALVPSVSYWSAELDIPLSVCQVESTETTTGNKQTSVLPAYPTVPLVGVPWAQLEHEFLGFASLYREALNTNSPPYRYLCLYKVIEGVRGRRGRLAAEAKRSGQPPRRFQLEDVPEKKEEFVPWLNAIFSVRPAWDAMTLEAIFVPETRGRSFGNVLEKFLTPLRVKIAHALSQRSGELTMSADDLLHIREVNKWLPLVKCIVRRMMKNEFPTQFLRYLRDDGTLAP